jgi:SepF-like predicted cell division protein (DUF552 family)
MGLEEKKMPFNLFRKKKQPEQEKPAVPPQEEPKQQAPVSIQEELQKEPQAPVQETTKDPAVTTQEQPQQTPATFQEQPQETVAPPAEQKQEPIFAPTAEQKPQAKEAPNKTYLKAMPLRELSDLENIKAEVKNGNIIILRVTPLAGKSIEDVKTAVNDLFQFADSVGGDIARLGEERVVITPKTVRIWREKSPAPVSSSSQPLPTAA